MLSRRLPLALFGYALLAAAGAAWCAWRVSDGAAPFGEPVLRLAYPERLATSVVLSAFLALCSIASTRALARRTRWGRTLHAELRALAGQLREGELLVWAVASAVGEELFFRGALQPAVGVAIASIVFGLLHVGPFRRAWARSLWAVAMGAALGGIAWLTGDVIGPILAHAIVNQRNLAFIEGVDLGGLDGLAGRPADASAPPTLVGRRPRNARL